VVHTEEACAAAHMGSVGRDTPETPETLDVCTFEDLMKTLSHRRGATD
jgi:hypothetical protein